MEQGGGISIISPPSLTDNNVGKTKSNGLTSTTANRIMSAKEKLRVPWTKPDGSAVEWIKKGVAEMIGTAILVFLGCLGCVGSLGNVPSYLQMCLSFGFAVVIAITCVAHISGAHINPVITVGAVVCGQQSLLSALVYFMGQTAGGIVGYGLLKLITPSDYLHGGDPLTASNFCVTMLHSKVSLLQGFLAEVLATAVLVFMSCAVGDIRNSRNTDSTAIKFGLAVAGLCFGFAPYTGCSMNPARSFGPALFNNQWTDHWIFWFGPFAGALLGSLLYKTTFIQKSKQEITITPENGV
ncbi:aquaporin AQPcic-like [Phymastichus coffea]|uniref:aquaporin AQPcic-like n=1 Tax=Phymastichus coffea TaxID=108790 RepID=UPI00273C8DA6|nr:aquaporin AQPcic-like [Phymastichus coffea]XP_058798983.1 aquaporin AQPcic-like [Phymastichus coffea]